MRSAVIPRRKRGPGLHAPQQWLWIPGSLAIELKVTLLASADEVIE